MLIYLTQGEGEKGQNKGNKVHNLFIYFEVSLA